MDIRLHFLEAGGSLAPWRSRMTDEAAEIASRCDDLVGDASRRQAVDVLIRRAAELAVPEWGLGGCCYEAGLVTIAVAPEEEGFEPSLAEGAFGATLAHELHHSLRHAACGYGLTLGDALVSEGLADRFSVEVTGGALPVWGRGEACAAMIGRATSELDDERYDHVAWFFGSDEIPRWTGYALGRRVVSAYLGTDPGLSAADLVGTPGSVLLSAVWPVSSGETLML